MLMERNDRTDEIESYLKFKFSSHGKTIYEERTVQSISSHFEDIGGFLDMSFLILYIL
jgi:hypothetical protein